MRVNSVSYNNLCRGPQKQIFFQQKVFLHLFLFSDLLLCFVHSVRDHKMKVKIDFGLFLFWSYVPGNIRWMGGDPGPRHILPLVFFAQILLQMFSQMHRGISFLKLRSYCNVITWICIPMNQNMQLSEPTCIIEQSNKTSYSVNNLFHNICCKKKQIIIATLS